MVSGGGPLNRSTAVVSPDGKYILVAAASSVKLCSAVTGETVNSLRGHSQDVTAIVLDPKDENKVYTASLDATVRHWDLSSGALLATMLVGEPIRSMVIPAGSSSAYLQCDWHIQKAGKMLFLSLVTGKMESYSLRLHSPSKFAVSESGRYVATFFKHTVFVYSTQRPAMQPLKLYHTRLITCVAIDPTEECIAAGDVSGRILIWNAFAHKVPKLHKAPQQQASSATAATNTTAAPATGQRTADQDKPEAAACRSAQDKADGSESDDDDDTDNTQQPAGGAAAATADAQGASAAGNIPAGSSAPDRAGQAEGQPQQNVVQSKETAGARFARLRQSVESVPLTTVHWHAHPVGALCFSADGTLLLSGGQEGVLVLWQLRSGNKTFLPRLGGSLLGIGRSPADAACYVITQADNTVRVVNTATMKVGVSIHGMRPAPHNLTPLQASSAAVLAPGGGELVLPADNSMLQFWDAARDCHVDRLQVVSRNTVSLTQHDHKQQAGVYGIPQEPHVAHLAFSSTGQAMATVDVRPNAGSLGSDEQSLRFWQRRQGGVAVGSDQQAPFYAVNTFVGDPHRGGDVTSLAYHPSRNMAATTSSSGDFKIWVQSQPKQGHNAHWRCQSVGSYRGEPLLAAAFSSDGSILAVASQDTVSLWNPDSNAMISTLAAPAGSEGSKLCKLTFVSDTPYLAAYTQGSNASLIVWNLLTESVWWSYALTVSAMAVDPESSCIAVAVPAQHAEQAADKTKSHLKSDASTQRQEGSSQAAADMPAAAAQLLAQGPLTVPSDSDAQTIVGGAAIFLLDPATAQPKLSWSLGQATVAALMFALPNTSLHAASAAVSQEGISPLLVLTSDRQYTIARSVNSVQEGVQVPQPATPEIEDGPGAFEAAFGKLAVQRPAQQANVQARKQQAVQAQLQLLFDAPSHVLPPLSVLAPAFFDTFIVQDK